MYHQTTFIFVCCAVVMMVTASSSEYWAAENDYDADIGEDVKRRVGQSIEPLIRFGKRRMYQNQMNNEYDDLLEDYDEKRAANRADMMMRFGRALPNADKMLRFGRALPKADTMLRFG